MTNHIFFKCMVCVFLLAGCIYKLTVSLIFYLRAEGYSSVNHNDDHVGISCVNQKFFTRLSTKSVSWNVAFAFCCIFCNIFQFKSILAFIFYCYLSHASYAFKQKIRVHISMGRGKDRQTTQ